MRTVFTLCSSMLIVHCIICENLNIEQQGAMLTTRVFAKKYKTETQTKQTENEESVMFVFHKWKEILQPSSVIVSSIYIQLRTKDRKIHNYF